MFSASFSLNRDEVLSSLKTALLATITYTGLTVTDFVGKMMSGDLNYLISVFAVFGIMFGIQLLRKFVRDGGKINTNIHKEVLDQSEENINPLEQQE